LKCGAGEGWRSVGPVVREMKTYYDVFRRRGISYKQTEGRLTALVTSCVGTAF